MTKYKQNSVKDKSCKSVKSCKSESGQCVKLAVNAVLAGLLPIFAYEFLEEK